jgi:hypothetical protein
MDVPEASEQAPAPFLFSSEPGYALCRHILKELLPYEPHDVQIEGVCKAFDKIDLFSPFYPLAQGRPAFFQLFGIHFVAFRLSISVLCTAIVSSGEVKRVT